MQLISARQMLKNRINRLGWALTAMIGIMSVISSVCAIMISFLDYMQVNQAMTYQLNVALSAVIDTLSYLSYFILPALLYYAISQNKTTEPIRFKIRLSKYLPLMILSGIAIIQIAGIINGYFDQFFGLEMPVEDTTSYVTNTELVIMYMTISFAPAFAEEIMFRGVVYSNLRTFGKTFAVLASALTFALMHQNPSQFFYTMVAGIVMALIYEATSSIWGGVILHLFNNLYAILQSAIIYRYSETTATIILTLAQLSLIILGVISTIILMMVTKKNEAEKNIAPKGIFGDHADHHVGIMLEEISFKTAMKAMFTTPGMLVYIILTLSSIFLTTMAGMILSSAGGGF